MEGQRHEAAFRLDIHRKIHKRALKYANTSEQLRMIMTNDNDDVGDDHGYDGCDNAGDGD